MDRKRIYKTAAVLVSASLFLRIFSASGPGTISVRAFENSKSAVNAGEISGTASPDSSEESEKNTSEPADSGKAAGSDDDMHAESSTSADKNSTESTESSTAAEQNAGTAAEIPGTASGTGTVAGESGGSEGDKSEDQISSGSAAENNGNSGEKNKNGKKNKTDKIRLSAGMKGRKKALFRWNSVKEPGEKKISYHVLVSRSGKNYRTLKKTTKKKCRVKGFVPGYTYRIKVRAYTDKKKINTSNTVRIYIPRFIKGLKVSTVRANITSVRWPHAYKADYYVLYEDRGRGFRKVCRTKKTYHIVKIGYNRRFRYRVKAFNNGDDVLTESGFIYGSIILKNIVKSGHQKYSYDEMASDIKALAVRFPGRVTYKIIGYSEDARPIYDVILGNQSASRLLLVTSALHAREYICSLLTMKQIEYYAKNYDEKINNEKVSSALGRTCIHFITMANPDGVTISQYGINSIRSSRLREKLKKISKGVSVNKWKANADGVDLNRSFSYLFKKTKKPYGSENCSGKKAEEESETRAVKSCIISLKNTGRLIGVINYHATGSIVFGSLKPDVLASVGENTIRMYDLARKITGYASAAAYEGNRAGRGNLREYVLYRLNIPSITLEIGRSACPVPISEFKQIWKKNKDLVIREAEMI